MILNNLLTTPQTASAKGESFLASNFEEVGTDLDDEVEDGQQ